MGIQGFTSFLKKNNLFDDQHVLKDTLLVIDGLNLANELNYKLQTTSGYDYLYGGDYNRYSVYVRDFFTSLARFNIRPLVIMDGSFNPSTKKQHIKMLRQLDRLEHAKKVYTNPDSSAADTSGQNVVKGLLNVYTFLKVLDELSIVHYKTVYDSAAVIIQIAHDLNVPVLSSDSDFYVYNLPAGVVTIRSVMENLDLSTDTLKCSLFQVGNFRRLYPGIDLDLVQIMAIILCKESPYSWLFPSLLRPLPYTQSERLATFLRWIDQSKTKGTIMWKIRQVCDPKTQTMKNIQKRFVHFQPNEQFAGLTVEAYIELKKDKLFPQLFDLPTWVFEKFIHSKMQRRLVSIWRSKVEWYRPLLEDCTMLRASDDCTASIIPFIYGLLRREEEDQTGVTCHVRRGASQIEEVIQPVTQLDGKLLPMISEMDQLSSENRVEWFWKILGLNPLIAEEIRLLLPGEIKVNESLYDQFITMAISLICVCRDFSDDFWLEFTYSLLINLLFSGYFCSSVDCLLHLEPNLSAKLSSALQPFNKIPPVSYNYKPRIIHHYNSFQSTLKNVRFVAQLLNLGDMFNADRAIFGLQGSFIYNLTMELIAQNQPLKHLQRVFLLDDFTLKSLYLAVLNLVLKYSNRKLFLLNAAGEETDLALKVSIVEQKLEDDREKYFIRALEGKSSTRYMKKLDGLCDLLNL